MHTLPNAIICDIDGTLAHMHGRGPFEWSGVGEDIVDETIAQLLRILEMDFNPFIALFSGRDLSCHKETTDWLNGNHIPYSGLYMRPEGDNRKDSIIKRELFEKHIAGKYNVLFVLDDRNQVVDMWRNELGLKCLQVAEGDF